MAKSVAREECNVLGMNLGNLVVYLRANSSQFHAALSGAEAHLARTGARMRSIGKGMMLRVTAPLALIGGVATKSFADFDDAMTKSTAIMSGVNRQVRKEMELTAERIARTSVTSLKDLASSYFFLASAGMDAAQSIAALPEVERFAVAGAFDMATATDLLTDAQSALGLSVKDAQANMRNMTYVGDILVKANTLANASVQQFSEALTNEAGPAIKQYNMDLEEGVAILATYADQGLKGNVAGSMMARMSRLLVKAINHNREAFVKLNIPYMEFARTGKNLTGVIEGISRAVEGMGPAQKAATLEALGFQARIQQAILPLLGATDKIKGYEAELKKAGGTTKKVADKQLTSFSSQMKIFRNNVAIAGKSLGKALAPSIEWVAKKVQGLTRWFEGLSTSTKKWIGRVLVAVAILGPLVFVLGILVSSLGAVGKAVLFVSKMVKVLNLAAAKWFIIGAVFAVIVWAILDAVTEADLGILSWFKNLRTFTGEKFGTLWKKAWLKMKGALYEMKLGWTLVWKAIVFYVVGAGHAIWSGLKKVWFGIRRGFQVMVEGIMKSLIWLVRKALGAVDFLDILGVSTGTIKKMEKSLDSWEKKLNKTAKRQADDYRKEQEKMTRAAEKRQLKYDESVRKTMEADEAWRRNHNKQLKAVEHELFLQKMPDQLKENIAPPKAGKSQGLKAAGGVARILEGGDVARSMAKQKAWAEKIMAESVEKGLSQAKAAELMAASLAGGKAAEGVREIMGRTISKPTVQPVTLPKGKKQEVRDEGVIQEIKGLREDLKNKSGLAVLG